MAESKRGGYRPGAGRPKTTLKAWCRPGVVMEIERQAQYLGVTPEELCGYLLGEALTARLMPAGAQGVMNALYNDGN